MQKTITAEDIIELGPCYSEEQVYDAVPREMTILEFLRSEHIPFQDRAWVLRGLYLLDEAAQMYFFMLVIGDIRDSICPPYMRDAIEMLSDGAGDARHCAVTGHEANFWELAGHVHSSCAILDVVDFPQSKFLSAFSFVRAFVGNPNVINAGVLPEEDEKFILGIAEEAYAMAWIDMLEREGA